jgi:hypothetical protein
MEPQIKKITELEAAESANTASTYIIGIVDGKAVKIPWNGVTNIDETLSIAGANADAKAVGDAFSTLKEAILNGSALGVESIEVGNLDADLKRQISLAVYSMQTETYDPRGYQQDIYAYAQARADEVQQNLTDAVKIENEYIANIQKELADAYKIDETVSYNNLGDALRGAIYLCKQYTQSALSEYKPFTVEYVNAEDDLPEIGIERVYYLVKKRSGYEKYWWVVDETGVGKWDSWGSSSTLVLDELPNEGSEDVDYIIKTKIGLAYYKWIDSAWKLVAGSTAITLRDEDEDGKPVDAALPEEGDELADYYRRMANGSYQHYRWIDGQWICVGGDVRTDETFQALQKQVEAASGKIETVEAKVDAQAGHVTDISATDDGYLISYGDETEKILPRDTAVTSVVGISRSGNALLIDKSDDTQETLELPAGGGTSSTGSAVINRGTLAESGSSAITCIYGDACKIKYVLIALDSGNDATGNGTATWYVNGIQKASSVAVNQNLDGGATGENEFDIGSYLSAGSNNVQLRVTVDTGGDSDTVATKTWTVNAVNLYFTWERDDSTVSTTDAAIRWTPYGDLSKTTHIIVDGDAENEITSTTTRSGSLQTYVLPKQSHGAHLVEMYMTATVNGVEIKTSSVYHDMIFTDDGDTTEIIGSSYVGGTMQQYNTVAIPVVLYNPSSLTANADVYVDDALVTTWTDIDRTIHYWNYSPTEPGLHTLKLVCGKAEKVWEVNVTALDIDNEEVSGYLFRLKASELAGNDALKAWESEGVTVSFSDNFDWTNGGLQSELDESGNTRQYLNIKAGTTMTIHHQLFGADCTTDGKNIKICFRLDNCRDYDAKWLDCYSGGIGLQMYAQKAVLSSEQSTVSVPYYEAPDDPIELEFDVWPKSHYAYIMPWIDGCQAGAKIYPQNDAFVQPDPQEITIGSADCDVKLYMMKAYDNYLSNDNHMENFIADAPNAQEMVERYERNDILDANGNISYLLTAQKNPNLRVHVYDIVRLFEGNKKAAAITGNGYRMFLASEDAQNAILSAENVSMKIQGTSSVGYYDACANWDSEFTEGLTDRNGKTVLYQMDDDAIPVDYINYKVNEASCEGSNNAVNVEWYNEFQPYIRPYRANTPGARDTMQLQPGVVFFRDQSGELWSGDTENYNLYAVVAAGNSKKNYTVFHDPDNPLECCVEIANNTSPQCLMTVACSDEDVRNEDYFEFRYPKKPTDAMYDAWKRFVTWMYNSNPNAATGAALPEAVTFGAYTVKGVEATTGETQAADVLKGTTIDTYAGTYTHDTREYRMAKMLSECEDYLILDSASFHYLFIETFTCIDNVVKNTFWGSHDGIHWYLVHHYDCDTTCGNDNEGGLTLTYGYEAMDTVGTKNVFNGHEAVWFQFFDGLYDLNRAMYINREGVGTWDVNAYLQAHTEFQKVIPERIRVQDFWYKYLRRYEQNSDTGYIDMLEGGLKTYQRQQFVTYQLGAYIPSKYTASTATNDRMTLRTYTPTTSGLVVEPKNSITLTAYCKMYLNIMVGSISKRVKAERGTAYTIDFAEAGSLNDTESYIYSAKWITAIQGLPQLYPGYMAFANGIRLSAIEVSSTEDGYANYNATSIDFGANDMLETLIIPNLPNAQSAMDLSGCQSLRYIDARGSGFTGFTFARGGVLETALLPKPASVSLRSLPYLETFSMEQDDGVYKNLTSVTVEDCSGIDTKVILSVAPSLVRVRLTGVNWTDTDGSLSTLLETLSALRGRNESDADIAQSVLAGSAYLLTARQSYLDKYAAIWPNLTVTYKTLVAQYALNFKNADGSAILNKKTGEPYVQYVDRGGDGYDPYAAGEIDMPTMATTQSTIYTYDCWDDDLTGVYAPRTVTATYTETPVQYSVRWHGENNSVLEEVHVDYNTAAIYPGTTPTDESEEGNLIFKRFLCWNKSTNCVTEDMDVYPVWLSAALPEPGKSIEEMNAAELYAIVRTGKAAEYVTDDTKKDRFALTLGYEPDFDNVESEVLAEDLILTGSNYVDTSCALLKEDASWTLMFDGVVDYPQSGACLMSCYDSTYFAGLKVMYNNGLAAQWGTSSANNAKSTSTSAVGGVTVVAEQYRELFVVRHVKGSKNVTVYMSRPDSDTILVSELTKTAATSHSYTVRFGADNDGSNYATGMVYKCRVWYDDLGDAECRKIAVWPRETVHFEVIGTAGASQPNGKKTNIDFIAAELLCRKHTMNSTNTNAGGYDASYMKRWIKARVVPAVPECVRDMILTVIVNSVQYVDGSSAGDVTSTEEQVYLPSVRDMSGSTSEPWLYCGTYIQWFTSDNLRRKAVGCALSDAPEINTASTPVASPKVGDLWVYSNGYIWNGRRWVRTSNWWLRDASVSYSNNFANVSYNGNVGTIGINATNLYGVCPRFSI